MRVWHLKFRHIILALALVAVAGRCLAQLPDNLSTDLADADTHLKQAFRPYFFDPLDEVTQWKFNWRSYYFNRLIDPGADQLATTTGGWIGWHSKSFWGNFRVGGTVFASLKLYGPESKSGTGLLEPVQQSFGGNSEAYLDWSSRRLSVTAGRMLLDTPYMHRSDIRMIPITFQGVRGLYHINPDWALGATYITKMKPINSPSFEGMYELAGVDEKEDGVMSLGTRYRYREGGELGFIAYHADDMINIVYSEFDHKFGFDGDKGFRLGFQYSHQESTGQALKGDFNINFVGARVQYRFHSAIFSSAYTQMSDTHDLFAPWGYSPTYNGGIVKEFYRAGEKSLSLGTSIDFSSHIKGLKLHTYYIYGDSPDSGPTASPSQSEWDVTLEYNFNIGQMEGFNLRIRNAIVNQQNSDGNDDAVDLNDFRIILNYELRL